MKRILFFLLSLSAISFAQTDNTLYVKQFPGRDVGTKVAAAQAACNKNTTIPCILVIDPSLAVFAQGTIPTLASNVSLVDYRFGSGGIVPQGLSSDGNKGIIVKGNIASSGTISGSAITSGASILLRDGTMPYNVKAFGAVGNGSNDETAAFNAALAAIGTSNASIYIPQGEYIISSTLFVPAGIHIYGDGNLTAIKYTGTGSLFSATNASGLHIEKLVLVGPGSANADTAITLATTNTSTCVNYQSFQHLVIEGFQTGINVGGTCNTDFRDIHMGLSKSGFFSGGDASATPQIGINIGPTVLSDVFDGITIFASQRAVQQTNSGSTTFPQGLVFSNDYFVLSFNDGTNTNQSVIHFENCLEVIFKSTWFTNWDNGHAASYSDSMVDVVQTGGVLVDLKFTEDTFFGSGVHITGLTTLDSNVTVENNLFYLYNDNGNGYISLSNLNGGFQFSGNQIRAYGTNGGGSPITITNPLLQISSCAHGLIANNRVTPTQTFASYIYGTVSAYMSYSNCSDLTFSGNDFPPQTTLSAGSDVSSSGSNTDVVVLGKQQTIGRQLTANFSAGTYNGSSPTIGSIVTGLTKPRMAIIQIFIGVCTVSNSGGTLMFGLSGESVSANLRQIVPPEGTSTTSLYLTFVGLVSGTVSFVVENGNTTIVLPSSPVIAPGMTITFI
jgi:hypothetical protein